MYIDTHAHYHDEAFVGDIESVLEAVKSAGCVGLINPAENIETCEKTIELCRKYDFVYGALGIHPHDAEEYSPEAIDKIREMCKNNDKIVAIGETGLDYHYDFAPRDKQIENFRANIRIASELKLPVIVHDREAHQDTIDVLNEEKAEKVVIHCFSGSAEMAKYAISRGWYISLGGAVTFKNAKKFEGILNEIPDGFLMLETDSPYMTPEPFRGRRNDSSKIPFIAEKIAAIRGKTVEEIYETTTENAKRFFKLVL